MKHIQRLYLFMLLVPTITTPAIWLRKDPQAIIEGQHNFFFPFLKEENAVIVRNYPEWASEILAHFALAIRQYPKSVYAQGKDQQLVAQAETILKKEYQNLMVTLGDPFMTALDQAKKEIQIAQNNFSSLAQTKGNRCYPNSAITKAQKKLEEAQNGLTRCHQPAAQTPISCTNLSPEKRKEFQDLLKQTNAQLFGEPLMKIMMVGIQGPKLEDFKRRAHIEDVYAERMKEINTYKDCAQLSREDKNLIEEARAHLHKAYNEVLDTEGLRTKKIMENV